MIEAKKFIRDLETTLNTARAVLGQPYIVVFDPFIKRYRIILKGKV